jgi:hypothetical protein
MMKKLVIAVLIAYAGILGHAASGILYYRTGVGTGGGTPPPDVVPTLVAGTAAPQGPTNATPSMSRWDPSCGMFGNATAWGVGCNQTTNTCIAPTPATPDQPCQSPYQFYPVSGSWSSGTATITYHSETNFVFTVGSPLNILNSKSWDTPTAAITTFTRTNDGSVCASSTDWCLSFTLAPTTVQGPVIAGPVTGFVPSKPIYVSGVTGDYSSYGGVGNVNFGWGQPIAGTSSYNNTSGVLQIDLATAYFGTNPTNVFQIQGQTYSGGTCNSPCGLSPIAVPSLVTNAGKSLLFNLAPGLASANLTLTAGRVFGTGQQGPNGKWTPEGTWTGSITKLNVDMQSVFPGGFQGNIMPNTVPNVNVWNWIGLVTQPAVVTASSCAAKTCTVSFVNPTNCTSACVTDQTTIVAGQLNGPVIAWNSGPIAPFAVENHPATKCVSATHISGVQAVAMSLDNGPWVTAKYMLDPWGQGGAVNDNDPDKAQIVNNVWVFCAQFDPATVADGLHELRAYAKAVSGPISGLTSAFTAEAKVGDPNLQARMHYLQDGYHLGVVKSQDQAFDNFNNAWMSTLSNGTRNATISNAVLSGANITYTYAPTANMLPVPAGLPVFITGQNTANKCNITGVSTNGNHNTYSYTGGCSFPVGSHIDVAGIGQPTAATQAVASMAYNSTTGDLAVTLAAAKWGTNPGFPLVTQYSISGAAGTGSITNVNGGGKILQSSDTGGTVLHFPLPTGLTISVNPGTGTVSGNTYQTNGNDITVTATNGSSTVTTAGMSISNDTGAVGTIMEAWDGQCTVLASPAPDATHFSCPAPSNSAATTWVSGGTVESNSALLCTVGGPGDNPLPFDPAFQFGASMFPSVFQVISLNNGGCNNGAANSTGCRSYTCGIIPTVNSTLWFYRHEAGTGAEIRGQGIASGQVAGTPNDGSFWIYTNAGAHMYAHSAYVDQWDPASIITSACADTPYPAPSFNEKAPVYSGAYCTNAQIAFKSMLWSGTLQLTATVANAGGCTTFTNTTFNTPKLVPGMPVLFVGIDKGNAGDGSDALLSTNGLYFVKTNASNVVTLSPKGDLSTCINETAANITKAALQQDLGLKSVFFRCNHSAGCNPPNSPETVFAGGQGGLGLTVASTPGKSGWLNYMPDYANGTGQHDVTLLWGPTVNTAFPFINLIEQTGHIHVGLDKRWKDLVLTPVVPVGPTPPPTAVTGGSLSGTCPGSACTETLTFTALANQFAGVTYQIPTSAAPGQEITVTGIVNNTAYNCGTGAAPCIVTAATANSVSFLNPTASGTLTAAGGTIYPESIAIEVANGTFPQLPNSGPDCTQTGSGGSLYQAITPPVGTKACVMNGPAGTGTSTYGMTGLFGFYSQQYTTYPTTTTITKSNCLLIPTGSATGASTGNPVMSGFPPNVKSVIVSPGKNDVIVLESPSQQPNNNPAYLYNPCGDFTFSDQGVFLGTGSNDSWDGVGPGEIATSTPILGYWWEGTSGGTSARLIYNNSGGVQYITNRSNYNANESFDNEGYAWGVADIFNAGQGANNGSTAFHMRMLGNGRLAPQSILGVDWRKPATITHAWKTYADYKAGVEILCSGHPCLNNTATVFQLGDMGAGTIPGNVTLYWNAGMMCGYYPVGKVQSNTVLLIDGSVFGGGLITWMDYDNNIIQLARTPGGTCDPITSSEMFFENQYHTDTHFMRTGPFDIVFNGTGTAHEFANRLPWATGNNFVIDNFFNQSTGDALAYFTEGGIQSNGAWLNSWFGGTFGPQNNTAGLGVDPNSYGAMNIIIQNVTSNQASTPQYMYNANTNPSLINRSPMFDAYYINYTPWARDDTVPTMIGYPLQKLYDVTQWSGYRSLSNNIFDAEIEFPVGFPLPDMGMWPSPAWQVDVAGHGIVGSGKSFYSSLKPCPWYCEFNDTGDSLE